MEVNGRFWGSLQLAIDAGVDFPSLAYDLAIGRTPQAPAGYEIGVTNRWLLGDLDHLLLRLFHDDADTPASAPSKLRLFAAFFRMFGTRVHYDVWSRMDPRPARYELREYVKALIDSAVERRRRLM